MLSPIYPWQALTVQSPWGVIIRAKDASQQLRHRRGSSKGGQFAAESAPIDPEVPEMYGRTQVEFKKSNRARVRLYKARQKHGTDPSGWSDEVGAEMSKLEREARDAKERFDTFRFVSKNFGVEVNALGKWTNSEPDERLMAEAADVRKRLGEIAKKREAYLADNPEIEAAQYTVDSAKATNYLFDNRLSDLYDEARDQGWKLREMDQWPGTKGAMLRIRIKSTRDDVNRSASALIDARHALQDAKDGAMREFEGEARTAVEVDNPLQYKVYQMGGASFPGVEGSMAHLAGIVSQDAFPKRGLPPDPPDLEPMEIRFFLDKSGYNGTGRPYCQSGDIYLPSMDGSDKAVVSHEAGHSLETRNDGIRYKANQFLKRRAGDEQPRPLREITGNDHYGDDEIGIKDRFKSAYTGKVYGDHPFQMNDTEVISMGIEYMATDPIQFAQDDPEFFDFIYTIARGG